MKLSFQVAILTLQIEKPKVDVLKLFKKAKQEYDKVGAFYVVVIFSCPHQILRGVRWKSTS